MTQRLNEHTHEELLKNADETGYGGLFLPCGGLAVRYWQDENGVEYAQDGSGCTYSYGVQSQRWHWKRIEHVEH